MGIERKMLVEKLVKSETACTNDNVNFLGFIFILSYFIFETCWAQICYVVEEDLEFLTLLPLLPESLDGSVHLHAWFLGF